MADVFGDLYQVFQDAYRGGPLTLPIEIRTVEPLPIYGPARTHRRRRIAKKWMKRYGQKIVGWDRYLGNRIVCDPVRQVAYCHPDVARLIEAQTKFAQRLAET